MRELLDLYSDLTLDGALGLLHATAVAPCVIPKGFWLPRVLKEDHASGDTALARYCIELLVRLEAEVQDALAHEQLICPDSEDIDDCEDFATGYVIGAELCPSWRNDANRWTFVCGIAYVADRLDVIPRSIKRDIEQNLAPDPKAIVREQMAALVHAAYDSFKSARNGDTDIEARVEAPSPTTHEKNVQATSSRESNNAPKKVGRNDPCPCGSGSKYKRCCMP
ncbi:MAG: SEC-C metal-binding domain-containing protein [Polyangiaceae bacterium]